LWQSSSYSKSQVTTPTFLLRWQNEWRCQWLIVPILEGCSSFTICVRDKHHSCRTGTLDSSPPWCYDGPYYVQFSINPTCSFPPIGLLDDKQQFELVFIRDMALKDSELQQGHLWITSPSVGWYSDAPLTTSSREKCEICA
jgi:hypothetical protein